MQNCDYKFTQKYKKLKCSAFWYVIIYMQCLTLLFWLIELFVVVWDLLVDHMWNTLGFKKIVLGI